MTKKLMMNQRSIYNQLVSLNNSSLNKSVRMILIIQSIQGEIRKKIDRSKDEKNQRAEMFNSIEAPKNKQGDKDVHLVIILFISAVWSETSHYKKFYILSATRLNSAHRTRADD